MSLLNRNTVKKKRETAIQGLVQREEMAMNHFLPHQGDRFHPPARRSM